MPAAQGPHRRCRRCRATGADTGDIPNVAAEVGAVNDLGCLAPPLREWHLLHPVQLASLVAIRANSPTCPRGTPRASDAPLAPRHCCTQAK